MPNPAGCTRGSRAMWLRGTVPTWEADRLWSSKNPSITDSRRECDFRVTSIFLVMFTLQGRANVEEDTWVGHRWSCKWVCLSQCVCVCAQPMSDDFPSCSSFDFLSHGPSMGLSSVILLGWLADWLTGWMTGWLAAQEAPGILLSLLLSQHWAIDVTKLTWLWEI